jgi:signal transduction histidine kinase
MLEPGQAVVGLERRYDSAVDAPPIGPANPSSAEVQTASELEVERRRWQEKVLTGILLSVAGALAVTAVFQTLNDRVVAESAAVTAVLILVISWAKAVPYRLRVAVLIMTLVGMGTLGMVQLGSSPNSFLALCLAAVLATALQGRRSGLLVVALTATVIAVIGLLNGAGLVTRHPDWVSRVDIAKGSVTLRFVIVYLVATTVMVLAPSALIQRAEALALEKARSLDALARMQAERTRIQSELVAREAAYQKAQELETLGRLSGTMAHDFNNALAIILASVEVLELAQLDADSRQVVTGLRGATEQAMATTRQLKVFGPLPARPPVLVSMGPLLESSGAALRLDEGQFLRILTNLTLNARDAMREGGRLTLRLRAAEGHPEWVALDVTDTGAGMSDEVKSRLFEPYFTTKGEQGTGLGLASVRQIVVDAGGRIEVASAVGRGTTVTVFWPVATPSPG